jgi:hypothetical protein
MKRRQLLLTGPAAIAWMAVRPALPQQATGGRPRRIGGLFNTPPISDTQSCANPEFPPRKTSIFRPLRRVQWPLRGVCGKPTPSLKPTHFATQNRPPDRDRPAQN